MLDDPQNKGKKLEFQVLIGILTIEKETAEYVPVTEVSSPYRYSNNGLHCHCHHE